MKRLRMVGGRQRGVGIVEVLVAAAILSLTVGASVLAASRWIKATSSTSMRNDGSQMTGSAMELAVYSPDTSWVNARLPATAAGNTTFSLSMLSQADMGSGSATRALVGASWIDAGTDGSQVEPFLKFEAAVLAQTWNQTVQDMAAMTPMQDPDHWLFEHGEEEPEPEPTPEPQPEPEPEPEPAPESEPEPEPDPEPEPEPEPDPWQAKVQFSVTKRSGQGAYSFNVQFDDGTICESASGGQTGGSTCARPTSLAAFGVSVSGVTAGDVLCSITPADLAGEGSYSVTLSPSASTLQVSLVVAQNSNQCSSNGNGNGKGK